MTAPIQLSRKKAGRNPLTLWDGLNEFLAFADFQRLSAVQRVARLAYSYSSHIQMAGHHDYFSTRPDADYPQVVTSLRTIGAAHQADILEAALTAVDAASTRAPQDYSNRFAAGVDLAELDPFDEAFESCDRSVREWLMDYARNHESEFIEWKP